MKKLVQRLSKAFPNTYINIETGHKIYSNSDTITVNYRIYIENRYNIMYLKSMDELKTRVNQIIKEQNEKK